MKRSEINRQIRQAMEWIRQSGFLLPPFADWTPQDWRGRGHEYDEIRDNMLGWDVTDYGQDRFWELGLVLFTIRNGNQRIAKYEKPYAEKLFVLQQNQVSPMHFHWNKMEDVINRGGGVLCVRLYNRTEVNGLAGTDVTVASDGRTCSAPAGSVVRLSPGQSITLPRGLFHEMTVQPGTGYVLAGEVSQCNDDNTDNFFLQPLMRFSRLVEDEAPFRLLCQEYPSAPGGTDAPGPAAPNRD